MLKYEDLTEEEKHLSILVVNSNIILLGTIKECKDKLSKYLPTCITNTMYKGYLIETMQDLEEFSVYHSGVDGCFIDMKDCNGKEFLYEIISNPWYARDSSLINEEDVYRAIKQRRLDIKANN